MFYLYILYSTSTGKYYVGHSSDPWRRLGEHNTSDFDNYTSKYRPWQLAAVFSTGESRGEAVQIEKFIKKQKSKVLIEKMVKPDFVLTGVFPD